MGPRILKWNGVLFITYPWSRAHRFHPHTRHRRQADIANMCYNGRSTRLGLKALRSWGWVSIHPCSMNFNAELNCWIKEHLKNPFSFRSRNHFPRAALLSYRGLCSHNISPTDRGGYDLPPFWRNVEELTPTNVLNCFPQVRFILPFGTLRTPFHVTKEIHKRPSWHLSGIVLDETWGKNIVNFLVGGVNLSATSKKIHVCFHMFLIKMCLHREFVALCLWSHRWDHTKQFASKLVCILPVTHWEPT